MVLSTIQNRKRYDLIAMLQRLDSCRCQQQQHAMNKQTVLHVWLLVQLVRSRCGCIARLRVETLWAEGVWVSRGLKAKLLMDASEPPFMSLDRIMSTVTLEIALDGRRGVFLVLQTPNAQ